MIAAICCNAKIRDIVFFKTFQNSIKRILHKYASNNFFCLCVVRLLLNFFATLEYGKIFLSKTDVQVHGQKAMMMLNSVKCKSAFCGSDFIFAFTSCCNKIICQFRSCNSLSYCFAMFFRLQMCV